MFNIGAPELLLIVIVAIIVIGPKDLPLALRTAGRWMAKMRKLSGHFRSGLDAMIREAEMEELEQKWREQNEKIMREHPGGGPFEPEPTGAYPPPAVAAEAKAEPEAAPQTEPKAAPKTKRKAASKTKPKAAPEPVPGADEPQPGSPPAAQ